MNCSRLSEVVFLLAVLTLAGGYRTFSISQPIGSWNSFTSQSTVLDLVFDDNGVAWAITQGGLLGIAGEEVHSSLSTTDGMYRINPVSLAYDSFHRLIWLGYRDGTFEAFDPQDGSFSRFSDIARATRFNPRGINQFIARDGRLLIATDFGLVWFDPTREVTIDTYSNLGDFPAGIRVNAVLESEGEIFAATPDGVAVSAGDARDLVAPDSWVSYGSESGFSAPVTALALYQDEILALSGGTIFRYTGSGWQHAGIFDEGGTVRMRISSEGTYLLGWSDQTIRIWPHRQHVPGSHNGLSSRINTVWLDEQAGEWYVGMSDAGIRVFDFEQALEIREYIPDGPYMNSFSGVHASDGVLISGSDELWGRQGLGTPHSGYYIYRNREWFNFNNRTHPLLSQYNIHSVFTTASTSDYFFFGSWGRGLVQHHRNTDEIKIWNHNNSVLEGVPVNPAFVVIRGLVADRRDHIWVVSWGNSRKPLYRLVPETGEWSVISPYAGLPANELYRSVTVDSHDQLWIPLENTQGLGRGLLVKRLDGTETSHAVVIRDGAGFGNLPHSMVNTVVQDRRGEIWIGTQRGLARFAFPQRVIDGGVADRQASLIINADEMADSPYLLRTSHVTGIAVNSANQKWVGTAGEGLWLIQEEGGRYRAVQHFTTENSPLISNNISSVAYDDHTGQIFIATDLGLVSYTHVVRRSVAEMDELFVYPNPFSYSHEPVERVVIDQLSSQTTLRILTVDGRLVRRLDTRGGRVEWDVRDFQGERLATGVYIIVSVDAQNDQRGVGKLVIIR